MDGQGAPADFRSAPTVLDSGIASSFAWRAVRVLGILGLLSLAFGLLTLAADLGSVGSRVLAGALLLGSAGTLALAVALQGGRAWAEPWAKAALLIVAATGLAHTVLAIASATLWIPIDTLMAVWALNAGDHAPPRGWLLRPAGLGLLALVLLGEAAAPLGNLAAELAKPPPDPNAVIVLHNESPRAIILLAGSLLDTRSGSRFVAPCGGVTRLPVTAADYQEDGRLMVFLAIDASGQLDLWADMSPDPSAGYDGAYSMIPIWSRGDLAGTLPLELVVHPDFTVDSSMRGPGPCTPNPSTGPAVPAG